MTDNDKSTPLPKPGQRGMGKSRTYVLITVLVALIFIGVGVLLVWSWVPLLPDPMATHWGDSEIPNGFESPLSFMLAISLIMGGTVFFLGAIGFATSRSTSAVRVTGGSTVTVGALVLMLVIVSVAPQRGLSDAHEATLTGADLAIVLGASLLAGVIAALLAPKAPPVADAVTVPPHGAPRADLAPGQDFAWVGQTSMKPGFFWGFTVAFIAIFVVTAVTVDMWWLALLGLLPVALMLSMASFSVRISPAGLSVSSPVGWPKKTIASAQIDQAKAVEVEPLQEFGGWGYRTTVEGAEGIILRKGQGIRVEYGSSNIFVVTLNEGATEAAALLNTAADWSHG